MNRAYRLMAVMVSCAAVTMALRADEYRENGPLTAEQLWELKRSDLTTAELERRDALLKEELAAGGLPEWAGEYYFGDGLGVNVRVVLAPREGFLFTWYGCLGRYDANYGSVEEIDGRIHLRFVLPNERRGFAGVSEALIPVHWGKRLYLIGADRGEDFANAINAGFQPDRGSIGAFLLRAGDENLEFAGKPDVPPAIEHLLLAQPIDAHVVQIIASTEKFDRDDRTRWRITRVQLNAGAAEGVWKGMNFYAPVMSLAGRPFTVEEVTEKTSIAVLREFEPEEPVPPAGFCVSTRMYPEACSETAEPQLLSPT